MTGSTAGSFKIDWIDRGREPQCPPNPAYPNGVDLDGALKLGVPTCKTDLPYPAKRCGLYYVECRLCGCNALITTAGRPDDPRSVVMPCKLQGGKQ
jgi:hypothetical protein